MGDRLSDRTAVVTGGASGIGRAIAVAFAREGADVVVADVRERPKEGGRPTVERVRQETDARAGFVECDVADREAVVTAVASADEFGGVDVMVNNAGIYATEAFPESDLDVFDRIMGVNARGAYLGSRAAARRMVDSGEGCILNLSSVAGLLGNGAYPSYAASKGAITLLTKSLADRLGPEGVRVNALHPGAIDTAIGDEEETTTTLDRDPVDRIPLGRTGDPADVADAAVFLAADSARYVTGSSLVVDGGWTCHL